mgnify:CR=1 FL=1
MLKNYYWAYGPYFDVDASAPQADGKINNVRRQFGNMILSKTPILSTRLFPLPKSALRERHNMFVGIFEGVVLQQDQVVGAHGEGFFHNVQGERSPRGNDGYRSFLGVFDL